MNFKIKKRLSLGFLLLFLTTVIAQGTTTEKTIKGQITYLDAPLANVNISILDSKTGTSSDQNGNYSITAKIGDIIKYSYVGFNTVSILVEDVTSVLNIEMTEKVNELEETVVTSRKKVGRNARVASKKEKIINTSVGKINVELLATKVHYLEGRDLGFHYFTLAEALEGKFSGKIPSMVDIDGRLTSADDPSINLARIKDVYVMTSRVGTAKWGGPVIIVRTMDSPEEIAKRKEAVAEQYRNQNYYNNDAAEVVDNLEVSTSTSTVNNRSNDTGITKEITGKVTYLDSPLSRVNVKIVGKSRGTNTNSKGEYTIMADVGDILQFSHLGYATVSIIVEDVTSVLNIEMVFEENELDAVTVESNGSIPKTLERERNTNKEFSTSRGNMDPKRVGFAMSFLDGEEVSSIYLTLGEALAAKMPGVRYDQQTKRVIVKPRMSPNTPMFPIWDIDGMLFDEEPPLDLSNVLSVRILRTLAGTNRYGLEGAGGVIVVQTKNGNFNPIEAERKRIAEQYTNKNYYSNDASAVNTESLNANAYTATLEGFNNKQKAFIYYDQTLRKQLTSYDDHLSIANKFVSFYKDANLAKEVLLRLGEQFDKNPEILKAVAFHLQAFGFKHEAIKAYESIFKLRPTYAQSYRDLANAYAENDQYKKAWRLYMSYLLQGHDLSGEGIGQLFYKEMEWLFFNRKNQTDIRQKFEPLSENLADFRDDIRMVFEWNTSEAEFDIEFVNPELRSYVFEHTLAANQDLITDEKTKGYSSNSYFIDDLGKGEWLINLTYKGNKKPEPTYFKLTSYYNWGKANQEKVVTVYRLYEQRNKIQLLKVDKKDLDYSR
ncbi:carboxypeptidase-like regulatory domain-containing protein [Flavobacteriaceae sp. LMIT009]